MQKALGPKKLSTASAPGARQLLAGYIESIRGKYVEFTTHLEIIPKRGARCRFLMNEIQVAYDRARTARDYILKGRQVGMTTEELTRDIFHALTREGARVVVVVQSITDHSARNQISEKLKVMFEALAARVPIRFAKETDTEWVFQDIDASLKIIEAGASLKAAQKKGRSGTITRLHITEQAFFEFAGETMNALLECVPPADQETEIVIESTANGAGGENRTDVKAASGAALFHWGCQDARDGLNGYAFHFFAWWLEPGHRISLEPGETIEPRSEREKALAEKGLSPEQLKFYRAKVVEKGQPQTDQEYPSDPDTCFLLSGRGFFDREIVAALLRAADDKPIAHHDVKRTGAVGWIRIWERPEAERTYVVVADAAEGTGGDNAAGHVYEFGTGRHMATLWGQFKPHELAGELVRMSKAFGFAWIAVERNNHGHAVIEALEHTFKFAARIWRDRDEKYGWLTHEVTRQPALDALEQAVRRGIWTTRDKHTLSEVRTFIIDKKGKPQASPGANDDLVLAAAIGWDVLRRPVVRRDLSNLPNV